MAGAAHCTVWNTSQVILSVYKQHDLTRVGHKTHKANSFNLLEKKDCHCNCETHSHTQTIRHESLDHSTSVIPGMLFGLDFFFFFLKQHIVWWTLINLQSANVPSCALISKTPSKTQLQSSPVSHRFSPLNSGSPPGFVGKHPPEKVRTTDELQHLWVKKKETKKKVTQVN